MRILLWNTEWATLKSRRGKEIQRIYRDLAPDAACITEGYLQFWQDEGNIVSSKEDYGYKITDGRRKVILVSTGAWDDVDTVGNNQLPIGRYCSGKTQGFNIHGVCIPWRDAHVNGGQKNRAVWEDHSRYLDALKPLIRNEKEKTIVLGDYNQRIPRKYSPNDIYTKLLQTFEPNFSIATTGHIQEMERQAIDHFAHTHDVNIKNITAIDNHIGALELSDHFGFMIEI